MVMHAGGHEVDDERVVAAVRAAEAATSAELRVAVTRAAAKDPVAAARRHFERLGMTRTPERNGVLIFVAPKTRNFAVIGDKGIDGKCGQEFWKEVAAGMEKALAAGDVTAAIEQGVRQCGEALARWFPKTAGDSNSLQDEVDYS